jgi:diguanylate cyclase (GGDEF)-like protein
MYRNGALILIAVVSVLIILALPLYLKFYIYPAYEDFLISNVEKEMKVLAKEMIKDHQFLAPVSLKSPLPADFIKNVEYIQRKVGLPKVKIFSNDGIIVYSTNPEEVGNQSAKIFFPKMLVDGLVRSEVKVIKSTDQTGEIHLIETYVPIYQDAAVVGVIEIYHNITGLKLTFQRMIQDEQKFLLPLIILLLVASLTSSWLAFKSMLELKKTKDQFQRLSVTDKLTGLLNRRGFTAQVEKQLSIINRCGKGAYLLYIDLDDFKSINDKFGHKAGDQALMEASGILNNTLRISDVIGRIGGDEFAALAINNENPEVERQIKERLLENLAIRNGLKCVGYKISFSIGVLELTPDTSLSVDELMNLADEKMYTEKQQRKSSDSTLRSS